MKQDEYRDEMDELFQELGFYLEGMDVMYGPGSRTELTFRVVCKPERRRMCITRTKDLKKALRLVRLARGED